MRTFLGLLYLTLCLSIYLIDGAFRHITKRSRW